ncbi:MAG: hypothetical protein AAFV29_24280, partial [Myxococcota bacterium]
MDMFGGRRGGVLFAVAIVLTSFQRPAVASEPQRLTAEVLTDFPLGIGTALHAEWSHRLRSAVSLQYLPSAYVDVADSVGQQIGGYNDITSALVRSSAQNALVLRFHVGWRPFADRGFYADVGYTWLALGGDVSTEDLAAAAGASPSLRDG